MTNIYDTWVTRLRSGRIEYGQMLQLKNTVWPMAHGGEKRGRRTTLEREECRNLVTEFERHRPFVLVGSYLGNGEWNQAGRDWIQANGRRAGFPPELVEHAQAIDFRLIGFHCYQDDEPYREDWGRQQAYSPIYSASIIDGGTFYCPECGRIGTADDGIDPTDPVCPDDECPGVSMEPLGPRRTWTYTPTAWQSLAWPEKAKPDYNIKEVTDVRASAH